MRRRVVRAAPAVLEKAELVKRFEAIRAELGVPAAFPDDVLAEAAAVVPAQPDSDLTDLPFVTLDPLGSKDLDQAMVLERRAGGFHVDYAIADVPAWVRPGGAIDAEAMRRGQTVYAPDGRISLHPPVLSEGKASLLPDGAARPAFVWRFDLDDAGSVQKVELVRALVRSRAQLDYAQVQGALDAGSGSEHDLAVLLREIGTRRQALELARGGANLPLPSQEVVDSPAGGFTLELRPPRPVEDWNAQLSLMTGMAAADLMVSSGVGVLRTLPPAEDGALRSVHRLARRLGVDWPDDEPYGAMLRRLDVSQPKHLALLHAAGALFRGSAYKPFTDGAPAGSSHAAVAADYAHVTAPLRRLVDRFGLVCAYSAFTGTAVPDWVLAGLPLLPAAMSSSDRIAGEVDRRCIDVVEGSLLAGRVGESFPAVVVDADEDGDGGRVQLESPPVLGRCAGRLEAGTTIDALLTEADPVTGVVRFALRGASPGSGGAPSPGSASSGRR